MISESRNFTKAFHQLGVASMGPRSNDLGKAGVSFESSSQIAASMGPRSNDLGKAATEAIYGGSRVASMGPRSNDLGKPLPSRKRRLPMERFNGAEIE